LIEANQVTIYKTTFNVVTLLQEIENNFKLNNLKPIDIIFDAREDEFMITSDSFRLRQIINNLIVNAIKFTDHGSVRFGYRLSGADVEFYVKDTGVGIASTDFDKIFDHFHKKELISGRVYRGTGIGLSICKSLAQLLGGNISVESKIGKGSVFKFTIPLL
jgi:signal transduction histidine kinase